MDSIDTIPHRSKLQFKYLPAFGKYLLEERLDDLTRELLSFAREIEFPLLKYFAHIPDDQLLALSRASNADLLQHMIDNTLEAQIYQANKLWKENQLPLMDRAEIVAKDLTLSGYLRSRIWLKFLKEYSADIDLCFRIIAELDEFQMEADSVSFQTFIDMQKGKLAQKNDELREMNFSLEHKNKELERSNKELTSFSYVASHDLQEPLRKIKTYSNMIMDSDLEVLSPKSRRHFNSINASAGRMQQLITDLLAYSRTHTYSEDLEDIDLNDILRETMSQYDAQIQEEQLTIESDKLPTIRGVAFQFRQLFENILSNSIKYRKPDTVLYIRINTEEITGMELTAHGVDVGRRYHRINISDNGIGFDQKYADKIFEIFQRLHNRDEYSGTGIGLAICKKIVQNHDGQIYASGSPGIGSVFSICLPIK